MQYVKIAKGDSVIRRKVRFFVNIIESGERVPCINATGVTKTLKDKLGLIFSTSDVYNWTNANRRRLRLSQRGMGDGFSVIKVARNKTKQELADERLGLPPIAEEESGDEDEQGIEFSSPEE
jgi:hypothetical protein